ncbi:MAG: hypothetical protein JSS86_10385 [Cyanobacteria bacterium SZAS LIN-2]|nr:hypothetical protein [Cyanobacteria bacterium SZAS LIN-2]
MPFDESALHDVNALASGQGAQSRTPAKDSLQAEAHNLRLVSASGGAQAAADKPAAEQPKSYLDVALGTVISNHTLERNVAEAVKTGAMFFKGRVGVAGTVALYALDQVRVGDSFGQAVTDMGLGAVKGTALRGINAFAAARDFGIAGQAVTLGVGSRVLDTGLNRTTWTDAQSGAFSLQQGGNKMLMTALDRGALATDIGAFAIGGAMAGGLNRATENSLRSSPFWSTTLTGGVFGLATGGTTEVRRQQEQGEQFDLSKVLMAGGRQAVFSAASMMPAGLQASSRLRNGFTDSHGVTIIGEKGQYKFGYRANGEVSEVLSVPAGLKGLREARVQLDAMADKRQLDLANTFGISFAKAGEEVTFRSDGGDHRIVARAPRLNELTAMELALNKSQPGQLSLDGQTGVKFNFVKDKDAVNIGFGGLFEYQGKVPNVFLHNEISQSKPVTARDYDPMPRDDGQRRGSLEQAATHEIAHHSDMKVRGQDPVLEAAIREKLGWVKYREGELDFSTHLLKSKDGELYKYNFVGRTWTRSDAKGNALDAQGKPAEPGREHVISNEEMMRRSAVPPISDYFNNPTEMLMEGFKEFRVGGDNRANLLRQSPILYEQVRLQDNRELGLHYGNNADGQSSMVRLPDGTLAKRDAQSEQAISAFEQHSVADTRGGPFGYQY